MADRYWILGTGTWSSGNTANWSTTSGGTGGASVPTSADTCIFDANSGTGVVTFTNGGVTVGATTIDKSGIELSLGAAFTTSSNLIITNGTFTTNNYAVTALSLSSNNSNVRTINLGSSTVTLSTANNSIQFTNQTNLTFNAGTSSIVLTNNSGGITVGTGVTFYDVSWTATAISAPFIQGANIFNNLSVAGRTTSGIANLRIDANQTINGTLTLSAGTNATARTFVRSDTIGTTRTLTCAAVASLTDIDFRDITIAGAAAPVSGTRLGDAKGNSGITFGAAKTVYWQQASSSNWGASGSGSWAPSNPGTPAQTSFPLAQDTAVFPSATYPASGSTVTINAAYNIGTIDMSARTSNTMTLATSINSPPIYGNWINGTGTTLTGTGTLTFAGRGSQTITSAGKTFTQLFVFNSPSGSVTLQDAFVYSSASITLTAGTFDANIYNVTSSATGTGNGVNITGSSSRTMAVGSGAWSIAGSGTAWQLSGSNAAVTGTGTISLTSASAKTFAGGGIQTYPTINQGGTGTLTVTGSNKFAGLTNTAIGRIQFTGGTTNIFNAFNISGVLGNLLQLGSTNTTQAILQKGSAWLMGANSTDAGNNTNLSFTAGGGIDYLSVSYINGTVVVPVTYAGNFFVFF